MNLPTEIFGDVIVVHTPEELATDQAENIDRRDRDVLQARAELNAAQRPNGPGRR